MNFRRRGGREGRITRPDKKSEHVMVRATILCYERKTLYSSYEAHIWYLSLFIIKVLKSFISVQLFRSPVLRVFCFFFFNFVIVYTIYCITAIPVLLCKYTKFVLFFSD